MSIIEKKPNGFSASLAEFFLPLEKKRIPIERHPLLTLCYLLQNSEFSKINQVLNTIPKPLRDGIFFEVWSQATDPHKNGEKWRELNALANPQRLLNAVKTVVEKKFDELPFEKKNAVCKTIYQMARHPQTQDLKWGENNAKNDLKRLICALHRKQHLAIFGKEIPVYSELEKDLACPSHFYHLNRPELIRGQIGLHNGMCTNAETAYEHAAKISSNCAQGFNLHCTYSATVNPISDSLSAYIGQAGIATPPALLLLEQWLDFFESNEDSRLLQICHSRVAIEVSNALRYLSPELRQRLIVITVAPACFIAADQAYRVCNLIVQSDPVVMFSANNELLDADHTLKLASNDDFNPHNLHGASFQTCLSSMISKYILKNDIL